MIVEYGKWAINTTTGTMVPNDGSESIINRPWEITNAWRIACITEELAEIYKNPVDDLTSVASEILDVWEEEGHSFSLYDLAYDCAEYCGIELIECE